MFIMSPLLYLVLSMKVAYYVIPRYCYLPAANTLLVKTSFCEGVNFYCSNTVLSYSIIMNDTQRVFINFGKDRLKIRYKMNGNRAKANIYRSRRFCRAERMMNS